MLKLRMAVLITALACSSSAIAQPVRKFDRLAPVDRLSDDFDVGLPVQDRGETAADDVLVVGDEHSDGHCRLPARGMIVWTVQPRSGRGPASNVPPSRVTRSSMPTRPYP